MESQSLMLGKTCLDDYVSGTVADLNETRKREISELIEQ